MCIVEKPLKCRKFTYYSIHFKQNIENKILYYLFKISNNIKILK